MAKARTSSAVGARARPLAEVLQEALVEHEREIETIRTLHRVELDALTSEIQALKEARDQQQLDARPAKSHEGAEKLDPSPGGGCEGPSDGFHAKDGVGPSLLACSGDNQTPEVSDLVVLEEELGSEGPATGNKVNGQSRGARPRSSRDGRSLLNLVSKEERSSQHGKWQRFVEGPFDKFVCAIIAVNSLFLFCQQQYLGQVAAADAGLRSAGGINEDTGLVLLVLEHLLNAFFLCDVAFRVAVLQWSFVYNVEDSKVETLNLFDASLVIATSADLYFRSSFLNFTVFRPLRFLRLAKVLRIGLTMHMFLKLKVLLSTVFCSILALFWSIVLLFVTMMVASLFANQIVVLSLNDERISFQTREWMYDMYGTSTKAYWSLFELTFSGGWPAYARPLVEEVSPWWSFYFFVYIVLVQFAMFRIITAIFLRDTLALAAHDAELAVQEKLRNQEDIASKLLAFFHAADTSHDGALSREEFTSMVKNPKVSAWLSLLEVEVRDAMEAFDLLQMPGTDDERVDANEFVTGMLRMKGAARSQDAWIIMQSVNELTKAIKKQGCGGIQRQPSATQRYITINAEASEGGDLFV